VVAAFVGASPAFCADSIQPSVKRRIAILEFDAVNDEAKRATRAALSRKIFTTAAFSSGAFDVVERHLIEKVLSEMEFGQGAVSGTVAQKVGLLVGAEAVLSGAVAQYRDELRIDARLVRVSNGEILLADKEFARDSLTSISAPRTRSCAS